MRPIDADEVQKRIDMIGTVNGILCWDAHDFIDQVPTIEAEPVRHGEWSFSVNACGTGKFQCSECKHFILAGNDRNYCPNCGCKMLNGGIQNG